MAVSAESVKSFLESVSLINSVSKDKLSRSLFLYERATKTTSVLTGMPGGGNADHEAVLANLADAKDDTKKWSSFAQENRKLVIQFLKDAEIDGYYRDLLFQRYVVGSGWNLILMMFRDGRELSERKLYYDHNKALQACADWVNKTGKYKEVIEK